MDNVYRTSSPTEGSTSSARVPRICVCVPVYNGAPHLRECLVSIQQQSLADFEVIIVDDNSSDDSFEIASDFATRDPRFCVHRNSERLGFVGNANRSIKMARAEWIKFACQDDVLMPACLERLLAACQREGKQFGFCARNFIFESNVSPALRGWFEGHAKRLLRDYGAAAVIDAELVARIAVREPSHNQVGEPTVTLIHKSLFRELGSFDGALIQLIDSEFWQRIMVNHGAVFVADELATFRIHAKAASTANREERAFRMDTLDRLVVQHRFAFGQHFKILRQSPQIGKTAWALRWDCARTAGQAWRQAMRKKFAGDLSLMKEWQAVKAHCPHLQAIAWLGCVFELPARLLY